MTKKERYKKILEYFESSDIVPETELHYNNPYQLVVAVSLSAQCTDKRVNLVTPVFFNKFPDFKSLSIASFEEVFYYIKSINFPNNKSKNLIKMAQVVEEQYNGELPKDSKELQKLAGVGRKTANVVTSVLYNQPTMAVDTHVFRVAHRLGLVSTSAKTPLAVELELIKNIPKDTIPKAHHWFILHGRYVCKAINPKCENCELTVNCKFYNKNLKQN